MATEAGTSGRPRSEQSRRAVLQAARELLIRDGLDRVSVDGIAARAGVGKATIYRWWPGKLAVAIDAVIDPSRETVVFSDTGDVRVDLDAELRAVIVYYTATEAGAAFLRMVAASCTNSDLAEALQKQVIGPLCEQAGECLRRGVQRGQLRPDLDVDLMISVLWGAIYHRLLVLHDVPEPDDATRLLEQLWPAMSSAAGSAHTDSR